MAKRSGVNKSEQIRQVLKANPGMKAQEVIATLDAKGVEVNEGLVYFIKGKMKGRKSRRRKASKMVARFAETTGTVDALATVLKVKHLATEVGGLKKLKALIEALSD